MPRCHHHFLHYELHCQLLMLRLRLLLLLLPHWQWHATPHSIFCQHLHPLTVLTQPLMLTLPLWVLLPQQLLC